jgi:hypothetical protein
MMILQIILKSKKFCFNTFPNKKQYRHDIDRKTSYFTPRVNYFFYIKIIYTSVSNIYLFVNNYKYKLKNLYIHVIK